MSLTSLMNNRNNRELFKSIAPAKVDFKSLNDERPFCRSEVRAPYCGKNASLIGMAFDYLLRAQVARWAKDPWQMTVPWAATRALWGILSISTRSLVLFAALREEICDELGCIIPEVFEVFDLTFIKKDEKAYKVMNRPDFPGGSII